ncbi:MAG TPA: enhanced serine sensitivity protein SseB C-terminal domain-containing protein [Terriglobales bacterium]|nr:enhanced serine sensitivity protein SseB C-terminal domain-containing protein [Terriglobales bacterium]
MGRYSGDPVRNHALRHSARNGSSGTRLYIGTPDEPPSEALLNCVRELSRRSLVISAAYAFNMAVGDNLPSLSIGLYFDTKPNLREVEELFRQFGRNIRPLISDINFVDLLPLDPSNLLGVAVRAQIKPFYRRVVQ